MNQVIKNEFYFLQISPALMTDSVLAQQEARNYYIMYLRFIQYIATCTVYIVYMYMYISFTHLQLPLLRLM